MASGALHYKTGKAGQKMNNTMTAPSRAGGKKIIEQYDGRGFEHKGIALHIRKSGTYWMISLFNTGLLTRGIGKTIKEAVELFDLNEGALIDEWKYQRGLQRLRDYQSMYFDENTSQTIDLTYNDGKIVIGPQVKAITLI
mgnify:CR=1 FL=1